MGKKKAAINTLSSAQEHEEALQTLSRFLREKKLEGLPLQLIANVPFMEKDTLTYETLKAHLIPFLLFQAQGNTEKVFLLLQKKIESYPCRHITRKKCRQLRRSLQKVGYFFLFEPFTYKWDMVAALNVTYPTLLSLKKRVVEILENPLFEAEVEQVLGLPREKYREFITSCTLLWSKVKTHGKGVHDIWAEFSRRVQVPAPVLRVLISHFLQLLLEESSKRKHFFLSVRNWLLELENGTTTQIVLRAQKRRDPRN